MERTENRIRALRDSAAEDVLRRIRRDRDTARPGRFRDLLDIVVRRLFDPELKVTDLWKETGIDPHNHVWFRELDPPTTPRGLIEAGRLDTAAEMLIRDPYGLDIWRIGAAVCFAPKAFTEAFKRRFGVTPSEYRAKHGRTGMALANAETALLAGFPAAALDHLVDADETDPRVAARLGLAWHGYASVELKDGRVDDAYAHLALARQHYSAAGELPRFVARHRALTYVSCKTDDVLYDALCRPCRERLLGDVGASLRRHLRDALVLVPTDLGWFRESCNDCYRVIWKAVDLARYGFLSDARHAKWLAEYANLEDRFAHPSVGRFIVALARVEGEMQFRGQEERLALAQRALAEAEMLRRPLLVEQARLWVGNVQLASACYTEARRKLKLSRDFGNPWLLALHHRFFARLERHTNNYREALARYRTAAALYKMLDPLVTGKLLFEMAYLHVHRECYEEAVELFRESLAYFDSRRDPLPAAAAVPIGLAAATAKLGLAERAQAEISRCDFDRDRYPGMMAVEIVTRGYIAQVDGRHREALALTAEAQRRFEELRQYRDAALAASQAVASHYALGERAEALSCWAAAARLFEAAGCNHDLLEAMKQLQGLLRSRADVGAVSAGVRRIARLQPA